MTVSIRDYINELDRRFAASELAFGHGTGNARDEAVYLVYGALEIDFERPVDSLDRELQPKEFEQLENLARQRIDEQVPVAYLVGKAWFAGRPFLCDRRAIIPRSPIAELIVNDFQPLLRAAPERVLDLCAGGGCIGIACALQFPQSQVDLADLSGDCLGLAQDNIRLHGLEQRVRTVQSDLFAALKGDYDLIVSNPPYVGREEYESLPAEYQHEPETALVSEEDGLDIPLRILRHAAEFLRPQGVLVMEVGYSAPRLQARLGKMPLLWLEFEEGGEGVLALTATQLAQYSDILN